MSLKLIAASYILSDKMRKRELRLLYERTAFGLLDILKKAAPSASIEEIPPLVGSLEEMRYQMTNVHNRLVNRLISEMGRERTLEEGRMALFQVGKIIGEDVRKRLGVADSVDDVIRAARIMYTVLGIEFEIEKDEKGTKMVVDRCALSRGYSHDTCIVLSAADEGVVVGLSPKVSMKFERRMTSGERYCVAAIKEVS